MKIIRFAFAHKTGSMFVHKALGALSAAKRLPFFSLNNGIALQDLVGAGPVEKPIVGLARRYRVDETLQRLIAEGHEVFDVCQVRHPLDMIVSQYFSHGWIHSDANWSARHFEQRRRMQAGALSVAEYTRMDLRGEVPFGGGMVNKLKEFERETPGLQRLIVFYEDFYHDYEAWAARIAGFLPSELELLPVLHSLKPNYAHAVHLRDGAFYEDPTDYAAEFRIDQRQGKHIRSAAPGDHTHFLTADEAAALSSEIAVACPAFMSLYA